MARPRSRRRPWRASPGLLLLCALHLWPGAAGRYPRTFAQSRPTLHEPVPVPQLHCEAGVCRRDGERDENSLPEAVLADEGLLRAPTASATPKENEPVYRPGSPAGTQAGATGTPQPGADPPPGRRTRVSPDRSTGPEGPGEHLYHEVFNPAVFPFKRMTVLDGVAEDETLLLRHPELSPVRPVGSHLQDGRDPFFGTIVIHFTAGQPVPIPSPAAGVNLLSFRAIPEVPLQFLRDGADNLYVMAPVSGLRRVVYLVDAPQRYFAGPLLPAGAIRPKMRDVPPGQLFRLPGQVQHHVNTVLRHIGVGGHRGDDYLQTLEQLVEYFRSFQQGDLTEHGASAYLDLALSQRGVCRHRSYAFLITALGAGIPARYVENELHVFVEVYVPVVTASGPEAGYWRRINLGGAPLMQRLLDTESKVAYKEKGQDPFPQPLAYRSTQPQRIEGLPPRTEVAGQGQQGQGQGRGERGARTGQGTRADPSGSRDVQHVDFSKPDAEKPARQGEAAPTPVQQDTGDPAQPDKRPDPPTGRLLPTAVSIGLGGGPAGGTRTLYRKAPVQVQGRVQAQGGSAADLEIYLFLDAPTGPILLGRTTTGPDGSYRAEVEVPAEAPLGDHRLIARVRGDDSRRGSLSGRRGTVLRK